MQLQPLAPTNPYWARVVSYGLFSLCVIHKKGLCFSSEDINSLMMTYKRYLKLKHSLAVISANLPLSDFLSCCQIKKYHTVIKFLITKTVGLFWHFLALVSLFAVCLSFSMPS
jgi:hypothetical protein